MTVRSAIWVCVVGALLSLGLPVAGAGADTTHVFLRQFTLDGDPQPFGVDAEGNIYVFRKANNTIGKYSPDGKPVAFSALGDNTIDGIGGPNCPSIPRDCDAVPGNGLLGSYRDAGNMAAVDTSNGPTHGYIYVQNPTPGSLVQQGGVDRIVVFAPSGSYLGEIDQSQAEPLSCFSENNCEPGGVSVDGNGHIYIFDKTFGGTRRVDQYVPVDGNPAHDKFSRQLRSAPFTGLEDLARGIASNEFLYIRAEKWFKTPVSEFQSQKGDAVPVDFTPEHAPFHEFGEHPPTLGTEGYDEASVDEVTQHVFLLNSACCPRFGRIVEFDNQNEQIGPPFGNLHIGGVDAIAFDHTGGPHDGEIYAAGEEGSNIISVFSPPVPVPDLTLDPPAGSHTSATVGGSVGLAGGPPVTACRVEFGPPPGVNFFTEEPAYKHSAPCSPAPPYNGSTHVSATLPELTPSTEYHYRIVLTTANGTNKANDHLFRTEAVLGLQTGDATNVGSSTATLNGAANPDGYDTLTYFEYGVDATYGDRTPVVDVGSGGGEEAIPGAPIEKLQSGRVYHYRLVAENTFGTSFGADRTLRVGGPPGIFGVRTTDLTDTSALLRARVDTNGYDTTYRFEFGSTPEYGQATPQPEGQVDGTAGVGEVTARIEGLQRGTTYHFRLVATNQWGSTAGDDTTFEFAPPSCPNALVRQQTSAEFLPDCRAYELVSPADAGSLQMYAGDALPNASRAGISIAGPPPNTGDATSPSRFGFHGALGAAPGTKPVNTLLDLYVSTRTDRGWVTTYPGIPGNKSLFVIDPHCNSDLSLCYDNHFRDPFGSDPYDTGSGIPYLWMVDGSSAGRLPSNAESIPGSDKTIGEGRGSATFSHYAFSSRTVRFTPEGRLGPPGSAYDNDVTANTVTLISRRPDGSMIPREPTNTDLTEVIKFPMVSADGSRILMSTADAPPCPIEEASCVQPKLHLYMRVDDSITYDVSGGRDVEYIGATADGRKVFFITDQQLSPLDTDSSRDLYMWSEEGNAIVPISAGNGAGDTDVCSATWTSQCDVQPVAGERPDLDSPVSSQSGDVYFYSPEQLNAQNPGFKNQRNLYVYREGEVQYVTTLDPGSTVTRLQVAPDGRHAAFVSDSRLGPYDNAGYAEMYSFAAEGGGVKCVACDPSGDPPRGDVRSSASGRFMSDDGRTFFSTPDPLEPDDTNGLLDVYEFVDGRPQLISSGTGTQDSFGGGLLIYPPSKTGLEAVSPNGTDVYFSTFDSLVREDRNGPFFKFYDARTNGGFQSEAPPLPCTAADECHGPGFAAPADPRIGTTSPLGPGGNENARSAHHKKKRKANQRKAKQRKARHRRRKHHG